MDLDAPSQSPLGVSADWMRVQRTFDAKSQLRTRSTARLGKFNVMTLYVGRLGEAAPCRWKQGAPSQSSSPAHRPNIWCDGTLTFSSTAHAVHLQLPRLAARIKTSGTLGIRSLSAESCTAALGWPSLVHHMPHPFEVENCAARRHHGRELEHAQWHTRRSSIALCAAVEQPKRLAW